MRVAILAGAVLFLAAGWPTESHDVRRTGQSDVRGPRSAERVTSIVLPAEQALNMPVTVSNDGSVYAGTWGMVRSGGSQNRAAWDKFDGKVFSFDRALAARWTSRLDQTPYCYTYGAREPTPSFCPSGGTVNGYNGTVEGTVTLDAARNRLYVGRGDGKLYAIDTATGAIAWRFASFNPVDRSDPAYETSAIYAVSPQGALLWRYPASSASMAHVVWAPPALSPDGTTLYVGGGWGPTADHWDVTLAGAVYALNVADGSVKWIFHPINEAEWWKPTVWTTRIAVGANGTIFAAGTEYTFGGGSAVLFALRDNGGSASYAWPRMIDLDQNRASLALGLALRETGGQTRRVYASSGNPYGVLSQSYRPGGKLVAVDAASGALLWTFDPETHGGTGAMSRIAIDAEGVLYTGVSGAMSGGRVLAILENGSLLWQYTLGGLLEWAHPVLGPAGDLYVGDTRRCLWMSFPIESGLCNSFDVNPRLYAIRAADSRRRAARH